MNYCTRCDRPLHDGEVCNCGLPERIHFAPAMNKKDKRFLTITVSSFIAVMTAIVFFVPPMLGFNRKCRQDIADRTALKVSEAAQAAIKELALEGHETCKYGILAYDPYCQYDYVEDKLFDEKFRSLADKDIGDCAFFIRVDNGEVVYTAASESWCSIFSTIGTYPPSSPKSKPYYDFFGNKHKIINLANLLEQSLSYD